jgi:cell wall-associated NlpC family hydrolase
MIHRRVETELPSIVNEVLDGIGHNIGAEMVKNVVARLQEEDDMWMGDDVTWSNASARLRAALSWARSQHGKRYQWGGGGNPSWDCSGFMGAIEMHLRGRRPPRMGWLAEGGGGAPRPGGPPRRRP